LLLAQQQQQKNQQQKRNSSKRAKDSMMRLQLGCEGVEARHPRLLRCHHANPSAARRPQQWQLHHQNRTQQQQWYSLWSKPQQKERQLLKPQQ
jgi:hypothetical protein